jgi:hypothetical protein
MCLTLFMGRHRAGVVIGHKVESSQQGSDASGHEKEALGALWTQSELRHREFGHDLHACPVSMHVHLVDAQKISNGYF